MKKTTLLFVSLMAFFVTTLTSCDILDKEKQLVGTWSASYDNDDCVSTNTYTFKSDNTFVEEIVDVYEEGSLKSVSEGTWRVKNDIIEFEYNLDKCKGYVDDEENEDYTKDLIKTNRAENARTTEYRNKGSVYGFTIVSVDEKKLKIKTGDINNELELTKK